MRSMNLPEFLDIEFHTSDEDVHIVDRDLIEIFFLIYPLVSAISSGIKEVTVASIMLLSFSFAIQEHRIEEIISEAGCLDACCFDSSLLGIAEKIMNETDNWKKHAWYIKKFLDPARFPSFFKDGKPIAI